MQNTDVRFHGLDTLRSVAILSVLLFHWWCYHGDNLPQVLLPAARLGWMGVDLFFVLSGYLIAFQLYRPFLSGCQPSLRDFYRNRLYRILPVFLVVFALYRVFPAWRELPSLAPPWQYLTFTYNFFVEAPAFSHVWSLCVEEHFYLLFPVIVLLAMRRPSLRRTALLIGGLVLFGMATRAFGLFHFIRPLAASEDGFGAAYMRHIYYPTYTRLDGLLAGVTLASVRAFRPAWWNRMRERGHLLLAAGLLLIAASTFLVRDGHPAGTGDSLVSVLFAFPLADWGFACLVASALTSNGWLRIKVPGAQLCAALAYSLYLTHKELFHLVDLWFPTLADAAWPTWLLVYLAVCFVVAGALHVCIERPFLRLRDVSRQRTPALRKMPLEADSDPAL